jgi:hypothetical protein
MLLVLSTVRSVAPGVAYILLFGLGSVLGMLCFSGLLAVPLSMAVGHRRLHRGLLAAIGSASVLLGASIVVTLWPA